MRVLVEKQAYQSIQENSEKEEWNGRSSPLSCPHYKALARNIDSYLRVDTQNHKMNRTEADLGTAEDLVLNKCWISPSGQNSFTIQ